MKKSLDVYIFAYTIKYKIAFCDEFRLGKWEKQVQETPIDMAVETIAADCVAVRTRLLNRVISSIYNDALRPLGVKVSQMNLLVVAAKLGVARPAEVCRILQMDVSTLSRNVDRMRAQGWLEVVDDPDGRAQPFRITPAGETLIQAAFPIWQQAQAQITALLGEDGVTILKQAVEKLQGEA